MNKKRGLILIGVGMAGLIVAIDFTIVNTVLPLIQDALAVPMNLLQWIMTGFGITFSSFLISTGRLGDLIGHRFVLLIGVIGFGVASLIAGLATGIHELIFARFLQGAFGSVVFPCGIAIISNAFPQNEQGRALGLYGSVLGIGLAIGPVLGGFITTIASWRFIFLINLPIIAVSFLICLLVAPESRLSEKIFIDWAGMILLTLLLSLIVFVITQSQVYPLTSPYILIPLIAIFFALISFIFIESKTKEPLIPFNVINNKLFFMGALVYTICIGLAWSIIFFIPLYLQTVLQFSEMKMGLTMLPMTLMTAIAPVFAGYLFDYQGPFMVSFFSFIMMTVGLFLCVFFPATFSFVLVMIALFCMGIAWGIGNGIAMPIALSDPKNKSNEGLISGVAITILNVMGVLILSIATALFHHIDNQNLGLVQNDPVAFLEAFKGVMLLLAMISLMGTIALPIFFANAFSQKR